MSTDANTPPTGHALGPLFETGQAVLLAGGLTASLLHVRLEHGDRRGVTGQRSMMLYDLADLTHNWPAIMSGDNRAHTADDVANAIGRFLDMNYGRPRPSDDYLFKALRRLRDDLRTLNKRLGGHGNDRPSPSA